MSLDPRTLSPALRGMRTGRAAAVEVAGSPSTSSETPARDDFCPWYEEPWRFAPVDAYQTAQQPMLPFYKPALEVIDERALGVSTPERR